MVSVSILQKQIDKCLKRDHLYWHGTCIRSWVSLTPYVSTQSTLNASKHNSGTILQARILYTLNFLGCMLKIHPFAYISISLINSTFTDFKSILKKKTQIFYILSLSSWCRCPPHSPTLRWLRLTQELLKFSSYCCRCHRWMDDT